MRTFDETTGSSTDPLNAIRQYPLVVVIGALVFGLLGAWYAESRASTFVATAGLLFEDARAALDRPSADSERYVADQVAILRSALVAERASALAASGKPPADISARQFSKNLTITSNSDSNFIEISFVAGDARTAQTGANAVRRAYQETVSTAMAENAESGVERLDAAIATTVDEIHSLQVRIDMLSGTAGRGMPEAEDAARIVLRLVELQDASAGQDTGAGLASIERLGTWADQLNTKLDARLRSTDVEEQLPDTLPLLRRQQDAAALLGELTSQRRTLAIDATLSGGGIAFFAPAGPGRREGIRATSAALVTTVIGGLIGAGGAYWLSRRRQRVEDEHTPSSILGVPLLVDVPGSPARLSVNAVTAALRGNRVMASSALLPMFDDPLSAQANAFRMLAGALRRDLSEWRAESGGSRLYGSSRRTGAHSTQPHGMVVACVTALSREANTFVAVNVALAAGQSGMRVAFINGDVVRDSWGLMDLLLPGGTKASLTDVIQGSSTLDQVAETIELEDGSDVSVVSVGGSGTTAPDLLGAPAVRAMVRELAADHDLVLINLPPVLEVAHAAAIQQADRALAVVPHGTRVNHLRDLRHRMDIMGVRLGGYAYMSPSRFLNLPGQSSPQPPSRTSQEDEDADAPAFDDVRAMLFERRRASTEP